MTVFDFRYSGFNFVDHQLSKITERMVRSVDCDVNSFLSEIDRSLEASRDVFSHFDNVMHRMSDAEWEAVQLTVHYKHTSEISRHCRYFLLVWLLSQLTINHQYFFRPSSEVILSPFSAGKRLRFCQNSS